MYYKYSDFLVNKYGAKTYKLTVNLPVTCPNRNGTKGKGGCSFCSPVGAGFECEPNHIPVAEQIAISKEKILKRHKAEKFIAYFQNFSNTYLPLEQFKAYVDAAAETDVCEIAVSTRPDVIPDSHILYLKELSERTGKNITVELGLQTSNDETLLRINRGHSVADYIEAAQRLKRLFPKAELCSHVILNLPGDDMDDTIRTAKLMNRVSSDHVKLHALYLVEGTRMAEEYRRGEFEIIPVDEYIERVICFLEHLSPDTAIQRLIGRAPQEGSVFMNWNMSWHRIINDIEKKMADEKRFQGRLYQK